MLGVNFYKEEDFKMWSLSFILTSLGLGAGLAMDAFSVSLANGLNEPKMKKSKMCAVAGTFAFFQFLMPMIGWFCVHSIAEYFSAFEKYIPWIALALLGFIGGKMLVDGIKNKDSEVSAPPVSLVSLIVQGIATSIDALSVGFTVADYNWIEALVCCLIIGVLTFFICISGIFLGKKFGTKFADKAAIFGGTILIIIGIEIFFTGIF